MKFHDRFNRQHIRQQSIWISYLEVDNDYYNRTALPCQFRHDGRIKWHTVLQSDSYSHYTDINGETRYFLNNKQVTVLEFMMK